MKKETLLEIILGTIGGLVFAIGMCMCLLQEWNMFTAGVITTIIGFVILLCIIPVYRSAHPKKEKEHKPINWGIVLTWTVGVVGSLIMGFGMSKIMVGNASTSDMVVGLITGVVGLVICVLNYPVYAYIKSNKE
ncbi:MAG: hypothetical protein IJE68_04740 [Clostridia bacterium]|nr:hypothetical protein [Clostridia bacterium]